jgi:predicted exporter
MRNLHRQAAMHLLTLLLLAALQRAIGFGITFGLGMLFSFLVSALAVQQQQRAAAAAA